MAQQLNTGTYEEGRCCNADADEKRCGHLRAMWLCETVKEEVACKERCKKAMYRSETLETSSPPKTSEIQRQSKPSAKTNLQKVFASSLFATSDVFANIPQQVQP